MGAELTTRMYFFVFVLGSSLSSTTFHFVGYLLGASFLALSCSRRAMMTSRCSSFAGAS